MSVISGLLEAAEQAAKGAYEMSNEVAPALAHLVGPSMKAEKPGLELLKRLELEELLSAKQGAKAVKEGLLPDYRAMSGKTRELYEQDHPGGLAKLQKIAYKKDAEELKALAEQKKQTELNESMPGWLQEDVPIKKPANITSALWERMAPEKKAKLYRKSGMAKIMSFHESPPEKLSNLLAAAEEAGRGVEGGVEPTLALPSVAHQSAERVAKEGKLPDNFGGVALVYGPKSVKPGLKDVETFDADAYLYRRPKHEPELTKEGKKVSWIGRGRRDEAYTDDPNLIELDVTMPARGKLNWGGVPVRDRADKIYEFPKDIDRGMVIDAFKLGPDDYAKTAEEVGNAPGNKSVFAPEMQNVYVKTMSIEDSKIYNLTSLWDERVKKNVLVKLPKREEDLLTYGFTPSDQKTTKFPDMEHRKGGRWIASDDPEAMRQHIKEDAGDLRFTEGYTHGVTNPSGFSGARAKYATPIKSETQLRASLGSFKHQKIPHAERVKLENAGDNFFTRFRSEGNQEALRNTPPPDDFAAFTSDSAHEYLGKLEKEGTGGNPKLDELGLQYLAFMKSVPSDYYEAKIFRHVPIKEAKALYMPQHMADAGGSFQILYDQGIAKGYSPQYASDLAADWGGYEGKHAAVLLRAMKKRKIPVVSDIGDLLKYAWAVPVIGPGAAYIAGDKGKQK